MLEAAQDNDGKPLIFDSVNLTAHV